MVEEQASPLRTRVARTLGSSGRSVLVLVLVGVSVLGLVPAGPASAQDDGDATQRLAERFAPVVVVRQQSEECDPDGEPFEPAPVDIVLDNTEVFLRQVGNGDPVKMSGPGAADIYDLREGWYLDFPGDALRPGCIFEQDYRRFSDGRSVVYAHVATEAERPGFLALQYWFFWYHNPSKNDHEGDWEFIQLLFDVGTVDAALNADPVSVGYAQHIGGERSDWSDPKLDRDGDRPIVYAARGSHASYFGQALYLGRSGAEGFGCDNTDQPSRRVEPDVVVLPDRVEGPDDEFAWLTFKGRWGQREPGFFDGPTGPAAKDQWTHPVTWSEGLRESSVVIPSGDRLGAGVLDSFCGIVEVGSSALIVGLRSPVSVTIIAAVLIAAAVAFARRTRWSPADVRPLVAERATGQILHSALRVWRDHPVAMAMVGIIYIPVAIASSAVEAALLNLPWVRDLMGLVGGQTGIAALLAVFVGGFGNLIAFAFVSAVVAKLLDTSGGSEERWAPTALSGDELKHLTGAVARAALIVIALLISVIGIPWALRQLVRYQMVPHVVALEGGRGRGALAASSELVRGRWWRTAGVVAIVQITFSVLAVTTALVILLAFDAIPIWLFNVLSSIIYVVFVPVGAVAMSYVYGSLVTRRGNAEQRLTPASDISAADTEVLT